MILTLVWKWLRDLWRDSHPSALEAPTTSAGDGTKESAVEVNGAAGAARRS